MDELFRFTIIRPPQAVFGIAIPLEDNGSDLQGSLRGVLEPRARRNMARAFRESDWIIRKLEDVASYGLVDALGTMFEALPPDANRNDVGTAIAAVVAGSLDPLFSDHSRTSWRQAPMDPIWG